MHQVNNSRFNSETGRERDSNEWFTPVEFTKSLIRDQIKKSGLDLSDSSKRILEPSAGEGHMIQAIIEVLTEDFGHDIATAESMIHAYELHEDNCAVIKSKFPNLGRLTLGSFL